MIKNMISLKHGKAGEVNVCRKEYEGKPGECNSVKVEGIVPVLEYRDRPGER